MRPSIHKRLSKLQLTSRLFPVWSLLSGQSARGGYLAAVDQGILSLSNFLATIVLARNVSPTELGVYGVGFIAFTIVILVRLSLNLYTNNLLEQTPERYDSFPFRIP